MSNVQLLSKRKFNNDNNNNNNGFTCSVVG
jgi:hypothetical protein